MISTENNIKIDDLIVEYMLCKVNNGYETNFLTQEFIKFLKFFESKIQVDDSLYEGEKLFQRFFERKAQEQWIVTKKQISNKIEIISNMNMIYSEIDNDYIISANYKLCDYDSILDDSVDITTKIKDIIIEYLSNQPKRIIDDSVEISEDELKIGRQLATLVTTQIWYSCIYMLMDQHMWPKQCVDIDKYLFDTDLSEVIGIPMRDKLLEFYSTFSKRIAVLYNQDKDLKATSYRGSCLSRANYKILIQGYEKLIKTTFKAHKVLIDIDLSKLKITEFEEVYCDYKNGDNYEVDITSISIESAEVKKMTKKFEKSVKKKN